MITVMISTPGDTLLELAVPSLREACRVIGRYGRVHERVAIVRLPDGRELKFPPTPSAQPS